MAHPEWVGRTAPPHREAYLCEGLTLTTEGHHNWYPNPSSHGFMPSALPLNYPPISSNAVICGKSKLRSKWEGVSLE